jgi:2-deoxy-D-gluconate 3-dehydrogenase
MPTALDLFRLDGRHAVVAGGAGLLGPSFAEGLLEAGARVTILDVDAGRLRACASPLEERFGARCATRACDLTDEASVERAIEASEAESPLDVLVNAAAVNPKAEHGRPHITGFTAYPVDAWRQSMDVNLTGAFLVTRAVCRAFERRGRGVVVNISSTYGVVGPDQRVYQEGGLGPDFVKPGDYSTTKAGAIGFTRYLAAYYARTAIRVNCLTPGGADNNHDRAFAEAYGRRTIAGRMARPDEYKGAIVFLCSDASSYMTGANLVVDGGWTAW